MGTKLYVGNLNYNTNEATLREAFGANGREVTSVSIIMDRETGRSRGFAFVEFAQPEAARAALAELDGQEVDGRLLRINEARERDARGPGAPRYSGPRSGGGGYAGGGGGYAGGGGGYAGGGGAPGGPSDSSGGAPGGAPGGGYAGRPIGVGPGARPSTGGFPPRSNFGPPAPPAGGRKRGEKERERDKGGRDGDGGKKKNKRNMGDDGW